MGKRVGGGGGINSVGAGVAKLAFPVLVLPF